MNAEDARRRAAQIDLKTADFLEIGALADAVRKEEIGLDVAIHFGVAPDGLEIVKGGGIDLLRAVAIARLTSKPHARIGVDWRESGFEIAQVALGFGASELVGVAQTKRGLPIADDAARKIKGQGAVPEKLLKKNEIGALVLRCRRRPIFQGFP